MPTYVSIDDFADRVVQECPSVPHVAAVRESLNAIREFCRRTRAWRFTHEAVDLVANQLTYLLADVPACAMVYEFIHVKIGEAQAHPWSESGLHDPNGYVSGGGRRIYYNMPEVNTVSFLSDPGALTDGLLVESSLIPLPDADEVPQVLYQQHIEIIEHKAKFELLVKPNTTYRDPTAAAFHKQQWDTKIGNIAAHVRAGNMTPRHRVRSHV